VIHWPAGITRPAVPGSLVSTIDLAPTILELAGVARPRSFQGVSLVPVLRDPTTKLRDFVFAERNWHVQRYHERMVRHGDFVYIRNNLPGLTGFNIVNQRLPRRSRTCRPLAGRYGNGRAKRGFRHPASD
jgi:N-sulfoglucosamine sulfohydrolase